MHSMSLNCTLKNGQMVYFTTQEKKKQPKTKTTATENQASSAPCLHSYSIKTFSTTKTLGQQISDVSTWA